jgi:hypothetical protein
MIPFSFFLEVSIALFNSTGSLLDFQGSDGGGSDGGVLKQNAFLNRIDRQNVLSKY